MAVEIDSSQTTVPVRILGVNAVGEEASNDLMCAGRVLPWLQDMSGVDVWGKWAVTWRDVVIIDPENKKVAVYNLTQHDLNTPANFDTLEAMLLRFARQ